MTEDGMKQKCHWAFGALTMPINKFPTPLPSSTRRRKAMTERFTERYFIPRRQDEAVATSPFDDALAMQPRFLAGWR